MTENDRQAKNILEMALRYKMGIVSSEDLIRWINSHKFAFDTIFTEPEEVVPDDIVNRLKKRAEIRLSIASRKSVQEGKPDRIAALLCEAAQRIEDLEKECQDWQSMADHAD